jgi:hypothetical protein
VRVCVSVGVASICLPHPLRVCVWNIRHGESLCTNVSASRRRATNGKQHERTDSLIRAAEGHAVCPKFASKCYLSHLSWYTSVAVNDDGRKIPVRFPGGDFHVSTTSRPALGPTLPPVQCVHGGPFCGIKAPGWRVKVTTLTSTQRRGSACVELYLHSLSVSSWSRAYIIIHRNNTSVIFRACHTD